MPCPTANVFGPHVYASSAYSAVRASCVENAGSKRKSPRRNVGPFWQFFCPKAGDVIRLRGDLRYYLAILLEADPWYENLGIPSIRVRARFGRRWITATPDLSARARDGQQHFFVAVYREQLTGPRRVENVVRRVEALTAWADATGARFAVSCDTQIWRCPQFLSNWAHVVRMLDRSRALADRELGVLMCRAAVKLGPSTIQRLSAEFSGEDPAKVMATLLGELHGGRLQADMSSARFSHHTIVSAP